MNGMKTTRAHELLIPSVGLLLVLGLWSAAPNSRVSARSLLSFSLSDGDNVTCYPIRDQKSLVGAKSYYRYPTSEVIPGNNTYHTHGAKRSQQTMALEVGACPDGTIPIRSPRGIWDDNEIAQRMMKRSHSTDAAKDDFISPPHEYGIALTYPTSGALYKGTEVYINVWDPPVESTYEFSLAQLWLSTGENTIEAGYQVSKGHYGDSLPRLFVYWTADSYKTTGCYDLSCSGFVQVSNSVLMGGSFAFISRQFGQQYEIKYRVFKDGAANWWLQVNDENVGYWPKEIYNVTTPFDYADSINWGGEIVDDEAKDGHTHTSTEMGSGEFANKGYGRAAYLRNLQQINLYNNLSDATFLVDNTVPNCYTAMVGTQFRDWGSYFFYGGKGQSASCLHDPAYPSSPDGAPAPAPVAGGP